jgi:NAD(P)-dependent dehydrogenase (short-subunit alcohol dehydrogenase family)
MSVSRTRTCARVPSSRTCALVVDRCRVARREKNALVAVELGEDVVFELDVRDEAAVERVVALVAERLDGLDIHLRRRARFAL